MSRTILARAPCPHCGAEYTKHVTRRRNAFGHVNARQCVGKCRRMFSTYEISAENYALLRSVHKVMEKRLESKGKPRSNAPPVPRDPGEAENTLRLIDTRP